MTQQAFVDVLLGPIQTSFAIDYVYFVIKPSVESPQPATVRLVYSDLKATLPDKVSVVREGEMRLRYSISETSLFFLF